MELDDALATVRAAGYVTLREKSYRQAQERQRVAEALLRSEKEHTSSTLEWARRCGDQEREAWARATYLYGLAAQLGATEDQLRGWDRNLASASPAALDLDALHVHDASVQEDADAAWSVMG